MGILDFMKNELVEVIDWTDDGSGALVYRFPDKDAAIKMGAQLTVREGQAALFLNEGKLADVFGPGRHELQTSNLPILTKLKSWAHGFNSPFKAEVYFVKMTQVTDQKWGTPNPIMMRDAELGAVRVRAFGSYSYRVSDPGLFLTEVVGTAGHFSAEQIEGQLRAHVLTAFTDSLGEAKIPVLDLAANYNELGETIGGQMTGALEGYGLDLTTFLISNISLPPAVEEMLDKRTSMGIVGDMGKYAQFQAANAMEAAASNPGGGASEGLGLGAGLAMGQAMAGAMSGAQPPAAAPAAPAVAASGGDDVVARLSKLKTLLDAGLISQEDFDGRKGEILAEV